MQPRTERNRLGLAALAGVVSASLVLARTDPGSVAPRGAPEVNVWIPAPVEVARPEAPTVRSRAGYARSEACVQGEWRWREPVEVRLIRAHLASALIVRLEAEDPVRATAADAVLTAAGEELASLFRVKSPEPGSDADPRVASTRAGASLPDPLAVERLHEGWLASVDALREQGSSILARAAEAAGTDRLRLSVTIAREDAGIDAAAYETCNAGRWESGGHRAASIRRTPIEPRFYGPVTVDLGGSAARREAGRAAVNALTAWLATAYAHEAAVAAHVAAGGDPRVLEAPAGSLARSTVAIDPGAR